MIAPRVAPPTSVTAERLVPLDQMRGLVMVLMAIDHSSDAFNAGRVFTDSASFYQPGTPLPVWQFLTRWITHICAPTFVFLAGVGLAFTVERQRARGESAWAIDRYLGSRGLVIVGFELWISLFIGPKNMWILQVLYAIGTSYLLMIPLRRLPTPAALAFVLLLMVGGEALVNLSAGSDPASVPILVALLLVGGEKPPVIIGYPTLHWLAMLLLGFLWGKRLVAKATPVERLGRQLVLAGAGSLLFFAMLRSRSGYGNMMLQREDHSLVQWLHVSKYPPSLTYTMLELGLMALLLGGLFELSRIRPARPRSVLVALGKTPMFFYLLHFPLLFAAARLLGVHQRLGLVATYAGALAVVAVLYPACLWYGRYKAAHRDGWTRYI